MKVRYTDEPAPQECKHCGIIRGQERTWEHIGLFKYTGYEYEEPWVFEKLPQQNSEGKWSRGSQECTQCRLGIQRYRLNIVEQLELLASQDGKCKTCLRKIYLVSGKYSKENPDVAIIDHFHGVIPRLVRGILCNPCNLKAAEDVTPEFLDRLRIYILEGQAKLLRERPEYVTKAA